MCRFLFIVLMMHCDSESFVQEMALIVIVLFMAWNFLPSPLLCNEIACYIDIASKSGTPQCQVLGIVGTRFV